MGGWNPPKLGLRLGAALPLLLGAAVASAPISGQDAELSGQAATTEAAGVRTVADEIWAFQENAPPGRTPTPLLPAPENQRTEWRNRLNALSAGDDDDDTRMLRGLLLELLDQADAMARCDGSEAPAGVVGVGAECYSGWTRFYTGFDLSAEELADASAELQDELRAPLLALAREHLGVNSVAEAREVLLTDERYRFPSRQAMRDESAEYLAAARAAMDRIVRVVPDEPLEIVDLNDEQGRNFAAAALYNPRRTDRAARFVLNSIQWDSRPRSTSATAAFHEGWPGHHYQSTRHIGREPLHPAVARVPAGAFVEGWGMYAELLADELDLYGAPTERIGYLLHLLEAAQALQIDAGLHAGGWSREQAIDSMILGVGRPIGQAEQYADRHLGTPGQTVSYMIGFREITQLRRQAEEALGDAFDIRDFHEAVMAPGPVPLGILRAEVRRWIAERAGG